MSLSISINVHFGTVVEAVVESGQTDDGRTIHWVTLEHDDGDLTLFAPHREEAEALAAALRNCARENG